MRPYWWGCFERKANWNNTGIVAACMYGMLASDCFKDWYTDFPLIESIESKSCGNSQRIFGRQGNGSGHPFPMLVTELLTFYRQKWNGEKRVHSFVLLAFVVPKWCRAYKHTDMQMQQVLILSWFCKDISNTCVGLWGEISLFHQKIIDDPWTKRIVETNR